MIIAHVGHWLTNLLYVVPIAVVVVALGCQSIKDRRERRREAEQDPAGHRLR